MTLGEIIKGEAHTLNAEILGLINDFEKNFGVVVREIRLVHNTSFADSTKTEKVNCKCEIHRS